MADGGDPQATRYWADERDQDALIKRCMERHDFHISALKDSGRWDGMVATLSGYYGMGVDGRRTSRSLVDRSDENGETVEFHTNEIRPVISNAMSLVVGQWPQVKPRAKNESAKALAATRLATTLNDAYREKNGGKSRIIDTVRGGYLASSWSIGHSWAPSDGKEWDVDENGVPIYEGDIQTFVLPPWRCVYDFAGADEASRKWVLFCRPYSRWDVAANLEERKLVALARKVREAAPGSDSWRTLVQGASDAGIDFLSLDALMGEKTLAEDVVWVWELRHLPSPALRAGRLFRFIKPDIVLWDSLEPPEGKAEGVEYPYHRQWLHVREYNPERVVTGAGGHSSAFDLGAAQEALDICTTSMVTTVNINGQARFWGGPSQDGGAAGAVVRAMGINGVMIESPTEPKVLSFPALTDGVPQAADWFVERMRTGQALNNVVMGQPDKGMPAQAMALQKATAIQYHAIAQGEFVATVKWDANSKLQLLKRFAKTKRVLDAVGKARTYELEEWSSDNLDEVECFDVEEVDPAANTYEARFAVGEMLVKRGLMSPEDFLTFMQTGNLEQGLQTKTAQKELVESNVALLQSGVGLAPIDQAKTLEAMKLNPMAGPQFAEMPDGAKVVVILKSDPHHLAVPAYLAVLSSPASRKDAKLMKAATEAIQYSMQMWQSLTPDEAQVFGIPPLPSQQAMMAPPPGPPGPDGKPAPGGPEKPPKKASGEGTPDANDIQQPVDPSTGEQVPGAPL